MFLQMEFAILERVLGLMFYKNSFLRVPRFFIGVFNFILELHRGKQQFT